MKKSLTITAILGISLAAPIARGQQPQATAGTPASGQLPIQKTVEAYLRNLYAFGADTAVKVAAPKDIGVEGLEEVDIEVQVG